MRKSLEDTIKDAMEKAVREATDNVSVMVRDAMEKVMRDAAKTLSMEVRKWFVAEAAQRTKTFFAESRKKRAMTTGAASTGAGATAKSEARRRPRSDD